MLLLLHIIVTYIKENIITKLQKLYSPPRNPRVGNKSPALFVKKSFCTDDLSPVRKILLKRLLNVKIFWQETLWCPMGLKLKIMSEFYHFDNIGLIIGTFYSAYILHFMDYWSSVFFWI